MSVGLGTAAIISAVAAVGSGTAAAVTAHQQGIAAADADKQKANVEKLNATQQQITMRQRMLSAIASQNAGTLGAVGGGASSGFGANTMRQITQGQNDLAVVNANESSQISLLNQAGANAEATGSLDAAGDIFGTGAKVAGIYSDYLKAKGQ